MQFTNFLLIEDIKATLNEDVVTVLSDFERILKSKSRKDADMIIIKRGLNVLSMLRVLKHLYRGDEEKTNTIIKSFVGDGIDDATAVTNISGHLGMEHSRGQRLASQERKTVINMYNDGKFDDYKDLLYSLNDVRKYLKV